PGASARSSRRGLAFREESVHSVLRRVRRGNSPGTDTVARPRTPTTPAQRSNAIWLPAQDGRETARCTTRTATSQTRFAAGFLVAQAPGAWCVLSGSVAQTRNAGLDVSVSIRARA